MAQKAAPSGPGTCRTQPGAGDAFCGVWLLSPPTWGLANRPAARAWKESSTGHTWPSLRPRGCSHLQPQSCDENRAIFG